ncbi:hypothetical protein SH591_07510 [Sphingomonas sp. LY54]|uniref:hypothetical protein n=1 Tax=Sphingomonas sp. LY54 TaxID=3095343 RepID=UPI002D78CE9B|nr:hypothetical protein [Sphingomonas sp. LY54]WRP30009.1 hypothetical protein SH591_07510 [Sphingomonas sp. LY54]
MMTKTRLAILAVLSIATTACATRWEPEDSDPRTLPSACASHRAPEVDTFPAGGLRAAYQFVTQDAPERERTAFIRATGINGFGLVPLTINLNGKDTLIAYGPAVLQNQAEVDAEFAKACSMDQGRVYLTHVRHNPVDEEGPVRVR